MIRVGTICSTLLIECNCFFLNHVSQLDYECSFDFSRFCFARVESASRCSEQCFSLGASGTSSPRFCATQRKIIECIMKCV